MLYSLLILCVHVHNFRSCYKDVIQALAEAEMSITVMDGK